MRKVNKKWSFIEHEDHIELKWRDYSVLIDTEDFWIFEECRLRLLVGTTSSNRKYYVHIVSVISGSKYNYEPFHRSIMNCPDDLVVDHINGNTLDNRKLNLRQCTHQQNMMNAVKKRKSLSKFKGVFRNGNSWGARIGNGGRIHIGSFKTEEEAAKAYNEKALELFGEFAKLNDI